MFKIEFRDSENARWVHLSLARNFATAESEALKVAKQAPGTSVRFYDPTHPATWVVGGMFGPVVRKVKVPNVK